MASIQLNNGSSISFDESTNYLSINNTAAEKVFNKHIGIDIRNISINHINNPNYLPSDDWDESWRYDYLNATWNNEYNVFEKNYDITLYGDMISVLEKNKDYENLVIITDNFANNSFEYRSGGQNNTLRKNNNLSQVEAINNLPVKHDDETRKQASAYVFTGKTIYFAPLSNTLTEPLCAFYLWEKIETLEYYGYRPGYNSSSPANQNYTWNFEINFTPRYLLTNSINYDTLCQYSYYHTGDNSVASSIIRISYDIDGYYADNDREYHRNDLLINVIKLNNQFRCLANVDNVVGPINGLIDLISDEDQNIKNCNECMDIVSDTNIRLSEEMILQKTYPNSIILGFYIPSTISHDFTIQLWHTNLDSFISSVHIKYEGNNAQEVNKSEFAVNSNNWHTITIQEIDLPKRFYIIITIPNIPDSFGSYTHNVNGTTRSPFAGNRFCYSVTFSDNFTQIPAYICSNMEYISFINIPNTVKYINLFAFQNCTSLKNVYLPDSVEVINVGAFQNCTSLEHIRLSKNLVNINTVAFSGCTSLKSVYMHNNVTHINSAAFHECTSLEYIKFSDKITYINSAAFQDCTSLYKIELPCDLETIGGAAFSGCTSLYEIILPHNVKTLGSSVFKNCTSLRFVSIWDKYITEIPESCFENCIRLERFYISKTPAQQTNLNSEGINIGKQSSSLTKIGKKAFYNAFKTNYTGTDVSVFAVPLTITEIGEDAFNYDGNGLINKIGLHGAKSPNHPLTANNTLFGDYITIGQRAFPNNATLIFNNASIEQDYYTDVCGPQTEYSSSNWYFTNWYNYEYNSNS